MSTRLSAAREQVTGDYGLFWMVLGVASAFLLPTLGGVFLSAPVADAVLDTYLTDYTLRQQLAPFVRAASAVAMFGMVWWLQESVGHRSE